MTNRDEFLKMRVANHNGKIIVETHNEIGWPYRLEYNVLGVADNILQLMCCCALMYQTLEQARIAIETAVELCELDGKDDIAANLSQMAVSIANVQDIAEHGIESHTNRKKPK